MSYYGIRKQRIVQNEEGKYNIQCDIYDSSLRDYDGKRIWYKSKILFNNWYDTKQDLEWQMFKDVLDGNIHGASGKYSCIGWNSHKQVLNKEETDMINYICELNTKVRHNLIEYRNNMSKSNIPYEEYSETIEYKRMLDVVHQTLDNNELLRYNIYYKAWKRYLKESRKK